MILFVFCSPEAAVDGEPKVLASPTYSDDFDSSSSRSESDNDEGMLLIHSLLIAW